jgi:hypothetical protein
VIRRRLFNIASAVSLALCILTIAAWYYSLDQTRVARVGSLEARTRDGLTTLHRISPAEWKYREQMAIRETMYQWFEARLGPIHAAVAREPWGSPAYEREIARFREQDDSLRAYLQTAPPTQAWDQHDLHPPIGWMFLGEITLLFTWLLFWWRRSRTKVQRTLVHYIDWQPANRLSWIAWTRRLVFTWVMIGATLLNVLLAAMWLRGHFVGDQLNYFHASGVFPNRAYDEVNIGTFRGGFDLFVNHLDMTRLQVRPKQNFQMIAIQYEDRHRLQLKSPRWQRTPSFPRMAPSWHGIKFDLHSNLHGPGSQFISLASAWWPICAVLLLPPGVWLWMYLRRTPLSGENHCRFCAYNLKGNASGVCPECGTPVVKKSEVVA